MQQVALDSMTKSPVDLAKATITKEIEALRAAVDRLGPEMERAVDMIATAPGKVITTGIGKSGLVARKIAATLCGTGTPALFVHPVDALHGDLGVVQEDDVALLLSKSGETPEVLTFCGVVKGVPCHTIAIVGRRDSSLARQCDVFLDATVECEACPLDLAPTSSAMVSMALGDALSACLVERHGLTSTGFSRFHPSGSLGKRLLLRVRDVMQTGAQVPLVEPGISMRNVLVTLSAKTMGAVIIASADGSLLGIFTDGDLRRCLAEHEDVLDMTIDRVMTRTPVVVREDRMAVEALQLMENRPSQIAVLPVVNANQKVVGIVRIHDLVRAGL